VKIVALIIASILAVAGWLKPEETPTWLNIGAVAFFIIALGVDVWLELQTERENSELKKQIADLHSAATRKPSFALSLNGMDVSEGAQIGLSRSGDQYPFELSLMNSGNQTANGLQVHLLVPAQLRSTVLGVHWRHQGTPSVRAERGYQPLDGITQHSFISPVPIHPGDWLKLGQGRLAGPPNGMNPMPLKVKVSVEGGEKALWVFSVLFQ
jgi:hypothetical protein